MITKYTLKDLRMVALDLVKTYNKQKPSIPARISNGYYLEVTDRCTRLVLNHADLISIVL